MQQRASGSQAVLKEEKLPPSPVMRGESFNPVIRPDHHKHPDIKPSQPGHSQQSEEHFLMTLNLKGSCMRCQECVCFCLAGLKSLDSSQPITRSSEPSGPPPSVQDKDKFKQDPKTPIAPKKIQVCIIFFNIIIMTCFHVILQ